MKTNIIPPTDLNALLLLEIVADFIFPILQIVHTPYTFWELFLSQLASR